MNEPAAATLRPAAPPPSLGAVVPFHDEAGNLLELHRRLWAGLEATGREFEIVYVDDGSRDGGLARLREAAEGDARVRLLRLPLRQGKSEALARGLAAARAEVLVTLDADLQDRPEEIPALLETLVENDLDMVVGWRRRRSDGRVCRLSSRLFNGGLRWVAGSPLHDHNCGLKLFRRACLVAILPCGESHRFMALQALWSGFRVGEREVGHDPRRHGRSKYGIARAVPSLLDLFFLLLMDRFLRRPLHVFGTAGVACLGAGTLANGYIFLHWFVTGAVWPRYPLLLFGILATLVGLQLLIAGLLAEIVVKLLHRPLGGAAAGEEQRAG